MMAERFPGLRVLPFLTAFRRAYACEHTPPAAEQQLDVALAARRMARRRVELGREPIRAKARQLCAEKGLPVPPALIERPASQ